MAYATLEDVKALLSITDTDDDDLLQALLERASAMTDTATGRRIGAVHGTRHFTSEQVDGGVLWLDEDLAALDSVQVDGVLVSADDITLLPANSAPHFGIILPEWGDKIDVTGWWGYAQTVPEDVVQAVARLAAYWYRQRDADFEVVRYADGTLQVPTGIPADVKAVWDMYRRRM